MCDMQKMPSREDACEEDTEMNFAAFSTVGATGTHYVTTTGLPVAKLQQTMTNNGSTLSQMVGMMSTGADGGVQYVRTLDTGATLHPGPQLITVPIALPGAKPGDPQQTVQIQVLSPNLSLPPHQQPKYQMQIPLQGFQQGAVLTVQYSPEANDTSGIQILGQNSLPDGLQRFAAMQEIQMMQPEQEDNKELVHHQVFITPDQQIIINGPEQQKVMNNNTSADNNNEFAKIIIKEECDEPMNEDESSQGAEASECPWNSKQGILGYISTLPPQQQQALPASLQQYLRLNSAGDMKKAADTFEIEVTENDERKDDSITEVVVGEDGVLITQNKKKKKYKKKPARPARPKPGQVVIATAADGTTIYCCPECQMAFPEKDQLETHLVEHKIERRFICGICGAGLKRKEHLERHKLGHNPERPYVCGVCRKGFKRREHLNLHAVIHSGVKTEMCNTCGKGFYRKDHLRKHTRSHESKRARDEAAAADGTAPAALTAPTAPANTAPAVVEVASAGTNTILPEITIHVPTSANMQVPVQINIPQHVINSLAAGRDSQVQLDALLARHS